MMNNIKLDLHHSNKIRVEYFLNTVDEKLEQIPFDSKNLSHVNDIIAGFKFFGKDRNLFITVVFATSYFSANEIGKANSLRKMLNWNWTVNGDVLFIVESDNEDATREILSHFAGKE